MRALRLITASLVAAVAAGIGLTASQPASAVEVSPVGERAFEDVTTCLTSGRDKVLNVHYLIDQSGSLSRTDPEFARVDILQNSVTELGNFVEQGIEVNVSAIGFASGAQLLKDWTPIDSAATASSLGQALGEAVVNAPPSFGNNTDWEQGLRASQALFSNATDGCSMMIWFTDGGINPVSGFPVDSLSNLCTSGISEVTIPGNSGSFGLLQEFRAANIPVFAVLLNNEEESRKYYQSTDPANAEDLMAFENWRMSFLKPLVEGSGTIPSLPFADTSLAGGEIQCGELGPDGFAPPGQANGAFIDAADPVLLAFQFLRIGGQISGGKGTPIVDGTFTVPLGTAGFEVILSSREWTLTGPTDSQFSASSSNPASAQVDESGGATRIKVAIGSDMSLLGAWELDTDAAYAELFVYSGMTLELDRDKTSTILGDFDNTLTGRVVRTQEFANLPIDLSVYPDASFAVSVLDNGLLVEKQVDLTFTPEGQVKIENFNPGQSSEELQLWLTLELGDAFQEITSQFILTVVDKTALATPSTDFVTLTTLEGPGGVATGELLIQGPNISDSSQFCLASDPLRLDDTQNKNDEPIERVSQFQWAFQGLSPNGANNCVEVRNGESVPIAIEVRNPTQANSSVVSTWLVTSTTEGTTATYEAPLTIEFQSVTQSNRGVEIAAIVILLVLGLLLPLVIMWLINFFLTRFLPVESVMKAAIPAKLIHEGGRSRIVDARPDRDGQPIVVEPDDFKNLMDSGATRNFDTGYGDAKARVPWFPLASTWYEWRATPGQRLISSFPGGSKHTPEMLSGQSAEISPNIADSWAFVASDQEFMSEAGSTVGTLVVFARMSQLSEYQSRISDISQTVGLGDRVVGIKESLEKEEKNDTSVDLPPSPPMAQTSPPGFTSSTEQTRLNPSLRPPEPPKSGPLAPPPPPS